MGQESRSVDQQGAENWLKQQAQILPEKSYIIWNYAKHKHIENWFFYYE